jgi:hypothetical protein
MYWTTGILGLLLIVAPFLLRFSSNPTALWTSIILGAAVAVASGIKVMMHDEANWEYWLAGILGLLAVVAPFILGFSAQVLALWASIILGVAIAVLSGYQIFFTHPHTK